MVNSVSKAYQEFDLTPAEQDVRRKHQQNKLHRFEPKHSKPKAAHAPMLELQSEEWISRTFRKYAVRIVGAALAVAALILLIF